METPILLESPLLVLPRLGGFEVLGQHLEAVFQRGHVLGGGERLFQDTTAGHLDGFLLEVADHGIARGRDRSGVCILTPGDDVEQRGLPGAVGADQRDAVTGADA